MKEIDEKERTVLDLWSVLANYSSRKIEEEITLSRREVDAP